YTATDTDGDTATGAIVINVRDDAPIAGNDTASVPTSTTAVTGNVVSNDTIGYDNGVSGPVTSVRFGSATYTIPSSGTQTINGTYGTLVIAASGAYTYTAKANTPAGNDVFQYTLRDYDGDTATANLTVSVAAHSTAPNAPVLSANNTWVYEDGQVALSVSTSANGGNGNDVITLRISGFTSGWTVNTSTSGGTYNSSTGVWSITLQPGQSFNGGPTVRPPSNSDVDLNNLQVSSTVYDPDSGLSATSSAHINVLVDAVADTPNLSIHDVYAVDSNAVNLTIGTSVRDTDGSEVIREIRIEGVPSGFSLNHGVYDSSTGRWTLTESQLSGLKLMGPSGFTGELNLTVTSVAEERNLSGGEHTTSNNLAYRSDTLTVDFYANPCDCDSSSDSSTVIIVNNNNNSSSSSTSTATANSSSNSSGGSSSAHSSSSASSSSSSSSSSNTSVVVTTSSSDDCDCTPITINNFNRAEGDILDLSGLIEVNSATNLAISDFVTSRVQNGNTIISVDADGRGSAHTAHDVVILQGVTGVSVNDIVHTDQIHTNV
ncbi:MAG: type I secretion C-terminal target domain-containing protein, partial [Alphaproteobacteria bacterium]|nr:type I secretion C-terminal target domain-containing protein [Alphaproteobacteria bacterium]